uniref:peptidylprolyl isomerase n=1 Tax=Opuntia streptacantha TaxID=393608 RepID=A0A7C8ZPW4_OPUST
MTFWGVEVKPGKPYTLRYGDVGGKLILTQATLGTGSSAKKSTLQCIVGVSSPVFLCTLLPDKSECCSLNLEFEEECDVNFSVVGPTSIHLSGFVQADHQDIDGEDCDSDSYGEDIAETETEDSDYDSEEEEGDYDFIDDDDDPTLYPNSRLPNRGVVIEEIVDDDKASNENGGTKQSKKKKQLTDSENDEASQRQIVVKGNTSASVLESEDEDGFPVSSSRKSEPDSENPEADTVRIGEERKKKKKKDDTKDDSEGAKNLKRKADAHDEESKRLAGRENDVTGASGIVPGENLSQKKKKKRGKANETGVAPGNSVAMDEDPNPTATSESEKVEQLNTDGNANGDVSEVKKKKKKKKKAKKENGDDIKTEDKKTSTADNVAKQAKAKPAKARTFANGLVIEELEMGRPDGKRASRGSKVSVRYIGKLQKNGKQFDSNIGRAPFKFRLGVGQVIKGWDVGVEGMRVGDRRRLTIPPSMGYGACGAPPQIPPNAWLVFDVELVNVA